MPPESSQKRFAAFEVLVQRPARICIGARCQEVPNPDLDYLLSVIDEVDPG
jgi:hypothetical protein